jgi:DNA invertase Pin-like site-specific DNA recombinase
VEEYFGDGRDLRIYSCGQPVDTRTASGRMLIYIQIVVSQYQRESTAERTAGTMAAKELRGERRGTIPFGKVLLDDGKTLVPCPEDLAVESIIRRLDAEGLSLRAIASELNARGYKSKRGVTARSTGLWSKSSVSKILGASHAA